MSVKPSGALGPQHTRHEIFAEPQTDGIYTVPQPARHVRRHGKAEMLKLVLSSMECRNRDDGISRTVNEKYRWLANDLLGYFRATSEHPRVSQNSCDASGSPQADVKGHHGALAKANNRQL
jgi:hypothetical protein